MGCTVSGMQAAIVSHALKQNGVRLNSIDVIEPEQQSYDPRLPLTVRQRYNIMKSWKGIARQIGETGVLMFLRLFETNEEVRSMFANILGNDSIAEMRENKQLEGHVKMVMYTLDEAISSLEDVDAVVSMLHSVAKTHRRLTLFNPHIFWKIEEPFLVAVKETLGDRYTANMERIYGIAIKFILTTLAEGFGKDVEIKQNGNGPVQHVENEQSGNAPVQQQMATY